jgi:4-amino-4-deoxy-L-arabinose transferase-like glycosyltransferase
VVAFQILLNLLTLYFLYQTARLLLPENEVILSVILFALALESVLTAFFILTETLFAFLLALVTWTLARYHKSPAWIWAALAGLFTGFAVLTRPIAILHPLVIVMALLFTKTDWRTRFVHAVLSLAITAALIAPWMLRNYNTIGMFTLSTISNHNILFYEAAFVLADTQHKPSEQVKAELRVELEERLQSSGLPNTEANRARMESEMADEIIRADPLKFVYVHLREDLKGFLPGVSNLLNVFGVQEGRENPISVLRYQGLQAALENYFGEQTWLILLFIPYFIFLGAIYLGGALGIFTLLKRQAWFELALLLIPIVYFLGLPGGASNARFRVPVMPHLCLLAGIGLIYLWGRFSARLKRTSS